MVKRAIFHPAALQTIRGFPVHVKRALGEAILRLQHGATLTMPLSRPMPSVAPGVAELRIKDSSGAYRAFYITRVGQTILIPHAFMKKSSATPARDIALGRRRLKELLDEAC